MFVVDLDELLATVDELGRCGTALDRLLDDVAARVLALHSTWTGLAAGAQAAVQAEWEAGFREIRVMESPLLASLVRSYLNQDVFDFYEDELAAIDDYIAHEPQGRALPGEIDMILATHSDGEIDALVTSYGIGFEAGDLGYRGWLQQIADRVRRATSA